MKLHYSKILLFSLPLNILVTSSYAHNKNKPSITPHHTPITTSRVLSECDLYMPKYDNDADMKSVKGTFDRQASQRFEEYEERIKDKRQKRKEERDKNIQEIIEKDRKDKSFAEKVEKGCLRCGCGLGGVAASIGLFGGLGIYAWRSAALVTAIQKGIEASVEAGEAAGTKAGKEFVIAALQKMGIFTVGDQRLVSYFSTTDYTSALKISSDIIQKYDPSSCFFDFSGARETFCTWVKVKSDAAVNVERSTVSTNALVEKAVGTIVTDAKTVVERAVETATDEAIQRSIGVVDAKYAICQTAIIASVVAILCGYYII
ncbi:hypothetical protein PFNF54_00015 [Plasmodium falciparum NF54]|uniref:Rifin n=1 Tax=Plasmodium falciparum (isolate NF54) TaxID=5843 RepID=W7K178_PLAFO|nr:hypothetical protein PFNF54_00015 [Plasmodium falciparum NF54]